MSLIEAAIDLQFEHLAVYLNRPEPRAERSAVANATAYELWVATGGDNDFALYGVTDARTTELERFVPNDVVDWYVAE